jgi:hypothetical protein
MKANKLIVLFALLSLVSCGKDSGSGSSKSGARETQSASMELVEATPGTYYGVLRPVNFHSNGFIPYGMATFTLKEDQLQVSTTMDDDQAVPHRQTLHLGTRCPSLSDDSNGDGFIDYQEAQVVVGPVLMPLDNDLNSQKAGEEIYPRGTGMTYNMTASLRKINTDLWQTDEDPSDNVMKLENNKGIGFENRVVLIHGTTSGSQLLSSLASYKDEEANISLPVVCGVLKKID